MRRARGGVRRPVSIGWKLAFHIIVLTGLAVLVTWVFQVFLLDKFYEVTKRRELRRSAEILSQNIDDPEMKEIASDLAIESTMRVFVYQITDTGKNLLVDVDATGGIGIYPEHEKIFNLVTRARENDGIYIGKIHFAGDETRDENAFDFWLEGENQVQYERIKAGNTRLVCVKVTQNQSGAPCIILLDAALFPLDTTVHSLEMQFIWIAGFLLIFAIFSVCSLYRRISKPLIRMNEAAKQLAKGKYDTKFVGEGYLETRELADTLNHTATELSRVDRLQKELLANISHDLRTPLTMIKGYGELMRDIPGENTPENMQVVIDETERLSELVNDLLDLSMLQSGNTTFSPTPFNLTEAIRESMTRYDTLVRHRGYRIDFSADGNVWVNADHKMILQVLYNLINNAINYTGEDHSVTVTQTVKDDCVRISITDTGAGIAPEEMPLIWDRYYKVDKVHRRAMVGTGLGLSIVKGILERHNAVYGVSSTVGQGSTFWFELHIIPVVCDQVHRLEEGH
ncbi:MAG: HAMP domain-containing protein [Clostridia bacterium]|nr:HAMP domain-containing protein [Clostridia bacterium]